MSALNQIFAMTAVNVKSLPERIGSSGVIVIGIAGVVGVLISVVGMTQSLSSTLLETGRMDRAIVLRNGANSEVASGLTAVATRTIMDAPGIARTSDGDAAASAEMIVPVNLKKRDNNVQAALTVRGVSRAGFDVRPEIKLVEGRMFRPGLHEVIVGRSAQLEFLGLEIGDVIGLRDSQWKVVGVFETGGDAHESNLITDSDTLRSAYQGTSVNSVVALLQSEKAFDEFKAALTTNPTLSVDVQREPEYYRRQSEGATRMLNLVTRVVVAIMALGALFAGLNTMYSAVSARGVEIATLRAIGFGAGSVVISVLVEALLLAMAGGVLGTAVAWLLFNGNVLSLGGGVASLVFELHVTPRLVLTGIACACAVGLMGGLFPAIRAARLPVATALRTG